MKLWPHVINPTPEALEWSRRSGGVKAMDRIDALQAAQPGALLIWRQSYANEDDTSDPVGTVVRSIAGLKGYKPPNLYLQLWTGAHPTRGQLVSAVTECHRLGYKTVGSSWFTGDYTQQDWDDATYAGVDLYGPQAYFGNQGFTIDHALRYRQFWKPGQKPVVILEAGRDAVEGGRGGWMKDNVSGEQYLAELLAYDAELEKDAYVLGACIFTSGPTPDWNPFNVDPISARLPNSTPPAIPAPGGTVTPPTTVPPKLYFSPNHGGPRSQTLGIVLHATLGNSAGPLSEYEGTINWFSSTASQVSAHALVGPGGKVVYPVDAFKIAWHCRESNDSWLGLEMCKARVGDVILPDILDEAARNVANWCKAFRIPIVWSITHGIEEHKNMPSNTDGHADVGGPFDRNDFLARVKSYAGDDVMTAAEKAAVLGDLDMVWAMSKADTIKANPAESERAIHERVVSLKVKLGLQ